MSDGEHGEAACGAAVDYDGGPMVVVVMINDGDDDQDDDREEVMVTVVRFENLGSAFIVMIVNTVSIAIIFSSSSSRLGNKSLDSAAAPAAICFSLAAPSSSARQQLLLATHQHGFCRRMQLLFDVFACKLTLNERHTFTGWRCCCSWLSISTGVRNHPAVDC